MPTHNITLVQCIVRARGGIDDQGLGLEEKAELASALSRSLAAAPFSQAAWVKPTAALALIAAGARLY